MTVRHVPFALAFAIFLISQTPPSWAQTCADSIRVPYRAQVCDGQSAQGAIRVSYPEEVAHIIAASHMIHSATPVSRIAMRVVVTPSGTVASATPVSGNPQWYEKATALAMTWRFIPFQRKGAAIYAILDYSVRVVPPEKRPLQKTAFPEVVDWDSVRITLQRTACRGLCPAYKLTIFGDGRVLYSGNTVDYGGEYHGRVSREVVRQVVDLFRSADYFNLFDKYGKAYDTSDFITSISFDGHSKTVVDEIGSYDGMPDVVSNVEEGIDRLAGSQVWVKEAETHSQRW
jgi:hypothetical protein